MCGPLTAYTSTYQKALCGTNGGRVLFTLEPHCRWKVAPHPVLLLAIAILPPKLLTSSSHSFLCQGLYTRYPSTSAQPLVTESLAARPGTPPGLAGKSQLCCQATAGGPSGSCLPRPGPPRVRSKPPRPWPGARTSFPAQMPPGSRRVGTCPRPRVGIGTRATRPPHLCLPDSPLFCAQFPPPSRVGSGSCPHPRRSRKPEGRGFPSASTEEVAADLWVRCPPCPDWAGVL